MSLVLTRYDDNLAIFHVKTRKITRYAFAVNAHSRQEVYQFASINDLAVLCSLDKRKQLHRETKATKEQAQPKNKDLCHVSANKSTSVL